MPGLNANPVGSVAATRPPQNALLRGVLGKLSLKDVHNAPSFSRCQLGRTPGIHEQKSHGDAIGYAHDVMKDAMQNASRKDAKALGRTLELLSYGTNDNLGPVLLVHLTAIGAVREGVAALLRESPGDEKLATHLKQLDDAIVKTGIKAGKCELAEPDAVYLAQYPSTEKVCDAVAAGKKVMTHCAAKIGGPALLAGIAQAVLPQAMMDSLAERLPDLVDRFTQPEGAAEWSEVLQSQAAWHLNKVLKSQLESGGTEDLQSAVIQLLKTPEYILRSQRGGEGDDSERLKRPDVPADAPAWVKQGVKDGAPILYNVVNCGGSSSSNSHRCGMQLEQVRNLLNDAREDAYERGRLTEIVRFQEHHIDRLERELQAERERNGPGEVRARKLRNETIHNASTAATPPDEKLDLIPDDDAGNFRANRLDTGLDQTDNSERRPKRQQQLNNASNSTLPPDSDLDQINPDNRARAQSRDHSGGTDRIDSTRQRPDQVQYPSNRVVPPGGSTDRKRDQNNGDGLVRRQPRGGDQTDHSNRPPSQNPLQNGSTGVVPPGDHLGDIPPSDNDQARVNLRRDGTDQTDSGNQRTLQRVGEGQQWLQRQPVANRRTDAGAPADDAGAMAEFKLYLQALGIKQDPPIRDPFPTTGGRKYFLQGKFVDGGPGDNRTLSAEDFVEYRTERGKLSGRPFVPFSTGRVSDPVGQEGHELIELMKKHGPDHLAPRHVLERNRLRPAKATPVAVRVPDTPLDLAFASMRKKRMEALYSATPPTAGARRPDSSSAQTASSPAAQPAGTGAIVSLLSFANAVSSNERGGLTRRELVAGSRVPRGGRQGQFTANQGLPVARANPPVGSEVARVVTNSGPRSQPSAGAEVRGQINRAGPLVSSLAKSLFSRPSETPTLGARQEGIAERESTHEAVQAWQRASFGEGSPSLADTQLQQDEDALDGSLSAIQQTFDAVSSARSIHEAALEQFARMVVSNPAGKGVEEPFLWSSDPGPTVTVQREVSMDSADSGNESPTRPKDDNWILRPVKPIAIPLSQPVKKLQRTYMDLSFLDASKVEKQDPATGARPQGIASDERHEDIQPASQGITDETPATSAATQTSPAKALNSPASIVETRHADRMDALIQELTQSFQKRAAAQAAT